MYPGVYCICFACFSVMKLVLHLHTLADTHSVPYVVSHDWLTCAFHRCLMTLVQWLVHEHRATRYINLMLGLKRWRQLRYKVYKTNTKTKQVYIRNKTKTNKTLHRNKQWKVLCTRNILSETIENKIKWQGQLSTSGYLFPHIKLVHHA